MPAFDLVLLWLMVMDSFLPEGCELLPFANLTLTFIRHDSCYFYGLLLLCVFLMRKAEEPVSILGTGLILGHMSGAPSSKRS